MPYAIRFYETGGPEVLRWESVPEDPLGPNDVRVRHHAVGLNYIDTYHRSGLYPLPLPSGLGREGAGVVEALGAAVTHLAVGDRVAYGTGPLGAYSESRVMPAAQLLKLPPAIGFETAAAMMLQGLTAAYLLRQTYVLKAGDTVLIHAAAGGVGLIACQWAKALGATVIGTVSTEEKATIARAHGCDHVILYGQEDFSTRVREITGGKGVPVVYDGVGKTTFMGSLACLQPRGLMVAFGNASGAIPPIDPLLLSQKGSLFLTRPNLNDYTATRDDLESLSQRLFDVVASGQVKIHIGQTYPLSQAAEAHRTLETRRTTGATLLLPA